MVYKEVQKDLFTLSDKYILAHCISADYALGAGIAKVFNNKYGVKTELLRKYVKNQWDGNGRCDFVFSNTAKDNTGGWLVANLVTKEKYWHKPTYNTLRQALEDMKDSIHCKETNKIGMPFISCGLDGLEWEKVSEIIKEVFADTDFEILVCYY